MLVPQLDPNQHEDRAAAQPSFCPTVVYAAGGGPTGGVATVSLADGGVGLNSSASVR